METGFYLELTEDFELPKKLYGNLDKKAEKILNTFANRKGTTGALLCGEKGSGKTLLTKLISTQAREKGMPTILVNMAAQGDAFNTFLSAIQQPAVVLFDEFEKTYDKEEQKGLLTLLDGVFASQKLCLLTSNDFSAIDAHMKNRPGRIFYYLEFHGLDSQFIKEYGQDNLKNPAHVQGLQILSSFVKPMNFDMLKAVVEESNRYDESPMETLEMLNVRATGYADTFLYELVIPGRTLSKIHNTFEVRCNPMNGVEIDYYYEKGKNPKDPKKKAFEYDEITFETKDLASINPEKGTYEFKKTSGETLKLKLKPIEIGGMAKVKQVVNDLNLDGPSLDEEE